MLLHTETRIFQSQIIPLLSMQIQIQLYLTTEGLTLTQGCSSLGPCIYLFAIFLSIKLVTILVGQTNNRCVKAFVSGTKFVRFCLQFITFIFKKKKNKNKNKKTNKKKNKTKQKQKQTNKQTKKTHFC